MEKHKKSHRRHETSRISFIQFEYEMLWSLYKKAPPNNVAMLLLLGSKFCIQTKKLDEKAFNIMLNRFGCDVRVKQCVQDYIGACDKPAPDLHIKNASTKIPLAPRNKKGSLNRF